eukprot:11666271-Ditylum_brightwellii.AAC.1
MELFVTSLPVLIPCNATTSARMSRQSRDHKLAQQLLRYPDHCLVRSSDLMTSPVIVSGCFNKRLTNNS